MTVYSGQYQVDNFSYDLKEFLKKNKNLAGMEIPTSQRNFPYTPTKKWDVIEEGIIYLSTNGAGNPYLITRVKVKPSTFSSNDPVERIAWSALRVGKETYTIGTKDIEDPTSVMEMSSGFWNPTSEFWLNTKPIPLGKLYEKPIGFMNWSLNPLP